MTTEEAIKMLERIQDPEPYEPQITKSAYDALQMGIDALKKHIPKKPIHVRTFENLDLAFYKCPNCGFIRRKDLFPQYCEFCGQAIDRSELCN